MVKEEPRLGPRGQAPIQEAPVKGARLGRAAQVPLERVETRQHPAPPEVMRAWPGLAVLRVEEEVLEWPVPPAEVWRASADPVAVPDRVRAGRVVVGALASAGRVVVGALAPAGRVVEELLHARGQAELRAAETACRSWTACSRSPQAPAIRQRIALIASTSFGPSVRVFHRLSAGPAVRRAPANRPSTTAREVLTPASWLAFAPVVRRRTSVPDGVPSRRCWVVACRRCGAKAPHPSHSARGSALRTTGTSSTWRTRMSPRLPAGSSRPPQDASGRHRTSLVEPKSELSWVGVRRRPGLEGARRVIRRRPPEERASVHLGSARIWPCSSCAKGIGS